MVKMGGVGRGFVIVAVVVAVDVPGGLGPYTSTVSAAGPRPRCFPRVPISPIQN